jgi:hypothetical protein
MKPRTAGWRAPMTRLGRIGFVLVAASVLALAMTPAALALWDRYDGSGAPVAGYAPYTAAEVPYAPYVAGPVIHEVTPYAPYTAVEEPYAPYVAGPVIHEVTPYAP